MGFARSRQGVSAIRQVSHGAGLAGDDRAYRPKLKHGPGAGEVPENIGAHGITDTTTRPPFTGASRESQKPITIFRSGARVPNPGSV